MNKKDFVSAVAEKLHSTDVQAKMAVNAVFQQITENLEKGEPVFIRDFGTFYCKQFGERNARNPATGEKFVVPSVKKPAFKASVHLTECVLESHPEEE